MVHASLGNPPAPQASAPLASQDVAGPPVLPSTFLREAVAGFLDRLRAHQVGRLEGCWIVVAPMCCCLLWCFIDAATLRAEEPMLAGVPLAANHLATCPCPSPCVQAAVAELEAVLMASGAAGGC